MASSARSGVPETVVSGTISSEGRVMVANGQRRAVGYVRVSTEEQATTGVSLDAQEAALRAYCTMRGLVLTEIIVDAGVSAGKPLASRDGGRRLLDRVRDGSIAAIVAYKLDRVFRDCADCLAVVRDWDERDVSFHLVDLGGQTIDTSSAMGRFFLTVMAGAAELERNLIGERTKAALAHIKREGVRLGAPGLGWTRTDERDAQGRRVVIELDQQRSTIERIVALRREGRSLAEIAATLEREGHPTKRGGRWAKATVLRIARRAESAPPTVSTTSATTCPPGPFHLEARVKLRLRHSRNGPASTPARHPHI